MLIRRSHDDESATIRAVHAEAFRDKDKPDVEPIEAPLVDQLRESGAWLPPLSLVAVDGEEIIGHVVCTRGTVGTVPALGLGPIGVLPSRQGTGVGNALMHAVVAAADALDEPLIALLGEPKFYGRFGFVTSTEHGIEPPEAAWGAYFQVRTLEAHRPEITGTFRYAEPFERL
ncbi:putative acetyltransferase [Herbihabitans rhizosphaerae]|uniref:Putative acetyltransferase n=1 Tax=Herbihabitans rhizosphaerae TaxID=1872711 RepID=A0A4Q7KZK6_9PSEU|nr:N-acetyltransferase [Herbihabitans rhizosphaerae]RZS41152.1 putative acetyltransferase [Herbihabitans rhizosphaerae]